MKEALDNAKSELRRVDHLFYVSLKYTRTVDMLKHVIERLISTYQYSFESLLKQAKENSKIPDLPSNNALRVKLLSETFPDDEVLKQNLELFTLLTKLRRAQYTKREEYRRHVTMVATIDNGEVVEVNIDSLGENFNQIKDFVDYVRGKIEGVE